MQREEAGVEFLCENQRLGKVYQGMVQAGGQKLTCVLCYLGHQGRKCLGHLGVLVVAFSAPERCIKQCCLHMLASMARIGTCVCKLI